MTIDRRRLREVVRRTLRAENRTSASISLALIDDPTMHELNRRHLDHDEPTDVLSFLLSDGALPPGASASAEDLQLEGEIIISTDTAVRQAAVYGWSAAEELTLYLVHGLLHLCGYDDLQPAARAEMRNREREILQIWSLTPHYDG